MYTSRETYQNHWRTWTAFAICFSFHQKMRDSTPLFYFTSPQPIKPKEASDNDFTIEDVMLWPVCASPCALNVSAALQGAYITPFPTEVVRAIRAQRDEAYVSKIVSYLHVMASNPHPPPWRAPHLHHFYFTSPQPIKPKEASDSDFTIEDVMLWPVCASPCTLNVSAALQGAYT